MLPQVRKFEYTRPWFYDKQFQAIFNPRDHLGNPARYSFIEASTKTGKTVGCMAWLFEQALFAKPNTNHWWVAPVLGQAEIAYRRIKRAIPQVLYQDYRNPLKIVLPGERIIWFKSSDNPDSLYGDDVHSLVVDEASRAKEETWPAVRSTLTATRGPARFIGNVKGRRNWMYKLARQAEAGEPGRAYYKIIAHDAVKAGILSADEIEEARRDLPEMVFRELYLAEPNDDGGNPFGITNIKQCVAPLSNKPPVAWGWDLGKSVDWTVGIGLDEDGRTCRFHRWQKSWSDTIRDIRQIVGFTKAVVDSTGVGDPIVEDLQRNLGTNFMGFKFSFQTKQQLMEGLAVAIQRSDIHFPEGPISVELETFEYEYSKMGVRYTAPAGYHDDCVASLGMAVMCKGTDPLAVWRKLAS